MEIVVQGSALWEIALPKFNICVTERLLEHGIVRELSAVRFLGATASDLGGPI